MNEGEIKKKPLISVITPVYNTELYLNECFDSLLNQSIGFSDSIELILIDDASTDSSLEICKEFQSRHPDNVILLTNEENLGISRSRNRGLDVASGKYISFLDSDDLWEANALEILVDFLEEHQDKVDVVFSVIEHFEGKSGMEYTENEYAEDFILETRENFGIVQIHVNNALFKSEAIGDLRFGELISGDEEIVFNTQVVSKSERLAHSRKAIYRYRKRMDNTNAEQRLRLVDTYYKNFFEGTAKPIIEYSEKLHGEIVPYAQDLLMHCIMRRLRQQRVNNEFKPFVGDYLNQIKQALQYVEDDKVVKRGRMAIEDKMFALKLKYGEKCSEMLKLERGRLFFNEMSLYKLTNKWFFNLILMDIEEGSVILSGRVGLPFDLPYRVYLESDNGTIYECNNYPANSTEKLCVDQVVLRRDGYRFVIPVNEAITLKAYIDIAGEKIPTRINYGEWGKLNRYIRSSYYYKDGIIVTRDKTARVMNIKRQRGAFKNEFMVFAELIARKVPKVAFIRLGAMIKRKLKRKPVWLFLDRINSANENAEFLFEYVSKNHPEVDSYYAISEDSEAFERVSKLGKVVKYYSKDMRDKFFICDRYVVSQTSDFVLFPSIIDESYAAYVRDLIPPVYAYLQHGVLEKDISATQNKLVTNFKIFTTSAYPEYEHMLIYPYGFQEKEIALTGLARHDLVLEHQDSKGNEVVFAPTWRHNISARMDQKKGGRGYNHEFIHSEFYKFYNDLINDERIISRLKSGGYKGVLRLHPYMRAQGEDFELNECFEISDGNDRYDKQFETCALLVTDYSSIASDYAYAKKPVIYAQFDKDTFYEGHSYEEGFFDYERDGFGPVCYDYESTVQAICDAIDRKCVMDDIYLERRKKFFAHFDGNNRERAFEAIRDAK